MIEDTPSTAARRPVTDPLDEGARELVITEDEFLEHLREPVAEFYGHGFGSLPADPARWPRRLLSLLAEKAHEFESFLDDFDARNNRRFSLLVELVASLRGFAAIAQVLHHVRIRFPKYQVRLEVGAMERFHRTLRESADFVHQVLGRLLTELEEQLVGLGVPRPETTEPSGANGQGNVRRHLPHDIDAEEEVSHEAMTATVLAGFLGVADSLRRLETALPADGSPLEKFVAERYDETKARAFESMIHNVQSAYDTHIKFTVLESRHPDLRVFRGHVSLALHMLEIATLLVHFYERHENNIQHHRAKSRIAELVPREQVLAHAIDFGLRSALTSVVAARPVAESLLPYFVQQDEIELHLPEAGMLHARPLSLIVSIVRHHGTSVDLVIGESSTVANSIMGLILFVGQNAEARTIKFRGDRRPLEDLKLLFDYGLGEKGMDVLPEQLSYLRS